jgi:hypothetical protein
VAEINRGVVASATRGLGFYSLAILETLLRLPSLGAVSATAAVEPHFVGLRFLTGLGFAPVGAPLGFDDRPRRGTIVQCLLLAVDPRGEAAWRAARGTVVCRLEERGYHLDSDLPAAPTSARVA